MSRAELAYWTCAAGACVCAILPFISELLIGFVPKLIVVLVGPPLWLVCFRASAYFARSVGRRTWWVALTAPFALYYVELYGVGLLWRDGRRLQRTDTLRQALHGHCCRAPRIERDTTGTEDIGSEDTGEGDYGRLLDRLYVKGVTSSRLLGRLQCNLSKQRCAALHRGGRNAAIGADHNLDYDVSCTCADSAIGG
jgi:hypothetical protein